MRWLAIFCAVVWAAAAAGQALRVPPTDEAGQDPSFAAYRDQLLAAVVARDIDGVLALTGRDIHLSYGGQSGHADFRDNLTVDPMTLHEDYRHEAAALREDYWAELENVLRLGGRFYEGGAEFVAPEIFNIDPPQGHDVYETGWIIGDDVILRDRPIRWGTEVARASWDVVRIGDGGEGTPYTEVTLGDGTRGFVSSEYLRYQVGYRSIFRRRQGDWRMTVFIAGD